MTKKEIKNAKEKIFAEYPQAVYMMTDYTKVETILCDEK